MKKTALVTGSSGFIGQHLVKHLEAHGYVVRGLDIKNGLDILNEYYETYIQHGLHQGKQKREIFPIKDLFNDVDYVFHLAGIADVVPSIQHPSEYMMTNVQGTVNVLEAVRAAGVKKFVYAASSSGYGDNPPIPTSESAPLNPKYPYALSKMMGEQACMHWNNVYGLPVNSLRLFNVYGPGQHKSCYGAVFSTFLAQRANGKPLTIVGDGMQSRDFVHVSDVCEAFRLAAETELSGKIWNVGNGISRSINFLAERIGGDVIHIPDRPGEPRITQAAISKIWNDLGWLPSYALSTGIDEMLEHLDEWKDSTVWNAESIAQETKPWFEHLGVKI